MRKIIYQVMGLVIIIAISWGIIYYIADEGVEMNPMIEQHIKDEYQTNNLSKRLLQSIEVIDLSNKNLTSIEGIEALTNLKELTLMGNLLTDVTPLEGLENLRKLDLSFNQITTLTLASEQLEKVDLEANRLTDITFLQGLSQLKALNLRANKVVDLAPIASLTNLKKLNIRGNQVKSLEPLENLSKLVDLNARNNQIKSIQSIVNLPLEKRLYLSGNDIEDLNLLGDRLMTFDQDDIEIPIPTPVFRVQSGVYKEAFELELRTEEHHLIYYTLDGSKPSVKSEKYRGPIRLSKEIMMAQAINANKKTSPMHDGFSFQADDVKKAITVTAASFNGSTFGKSVSHTYIFDEALFDSDLPVVSLTVQPKDFFADDGGIYVQGNLYREGYDRTGNYYQRGRDYEREATFEYFGEDGKVRLQQNVGLRINGSYTRMFPQKSLRIYARSEYGQSRIYSKLFEDLPYHEFSRLVLRSSGNDNSSTLLRDGLMHELVKGGNIDVQAYKPAIVLINGEYWGIHNIREKFTDDYIDIKYNVKQSDLVMMSVFKKSIIRFDMDSGIQKDELHYRELLEYIQSNDMTTEDAINYVDTQMDIENFLEYVAYQVYYGNTDSFSNNMTMWRKRVDYVPDAPLGHDGRWRWMLFDLDWGMGYGVLGLDEDPMTYNMLEHMTTDEEAVLLFKSLIKNDSVKNRFTEILLTLLNENFKAERVHEKIDELATKIRPEIPRSIERWENIGSVEAWEENIDALHVFADQRPALIRQHLKETFGYTDVELEEIELGITK